MELREEILKEHSKQQCEKIVAWVGNSQARFDELFRLLLQDEHTVAQRASWPLSDCVMAHPHMIKKHWGKLINNLSRPSLHGAVKRNSVRLMQDIAIPKKFQGDVMNICFGYLQSPVEEVAVKAFSLTVLANLAKAYPDITAELLLLIEGQIHSQTPAFTSRAKKVLKSLGR